MNDKLKTMSPKDANSKAQITISEFDHQAPVNYVSDGSQEQARQYADRESGLGNKLSTLGAIALGYTSLSSWIAYSASAATALASGGANVLVWGMIIVGICNMAAAVTIAEPASQFPNASGQAAWVYRLHGRFLSYLTSWTVLLGYVLLSVAAQLITTTILLAMINLTFPDYVIETWHVSVSIIVTAAFAFLVAGIASKLVSRLNFALVDITNVSGWGNNFIPWVLGLSQAALSTTALDVPTHFSEEMANPSKQVPIAIFGALATSIVITLAYAFLLVFTLPGLQDIITTSTGFPFAEILRIKTTRSGAIVLLLIPLVSFLITSADVAMAASRCIYGFSRQRGFPFSSFFGKVNKKFDSPLAAGLLVFFCQSCIGCIYIGNTAAFTAIISVPTLLLAVSYSIVAFVCLGARRRGGSERRPGGSMGKVIHDGMASDASEGDSAWDPPYKMPKWFTISANILTIVFTVLLCLFLSLPPVWPVTSANMNYTSAILIGSFLIPALCWIRYGKVYQGPLVH
ncbi:hypothetical protein NDA11_005092 [Ustilago hordei]|nr:hypothetical protein NDA10_007813 [Ustilago hordei]KAJ1573710.1 hypothetical protein NDA15_002200 [Ustilago hordei]KAJ1579376.1 hypothetical protein NDA11_005092 [Ustilago hordei]KAJ1579551.1 hypothetical protein NDA12_001172 [Ustilago hordei]UTT90861.1 hypothetical protein NDA17_003948 [Ustilago hordei]